MLPQLHQFQLDHEKLHLPSGKTSGLPSRIPAILPTRVAKKTAWTVSYLRDTAQQGGLQPSNIRHAEIGWDANVSAF